MIKSKLEGPEKSNNNQGIGGSFHFLNFMLNLTINLSFFNNKD